MSGRRPGQQLLAGLGAALALVLAAIATAQEAESERPIPDHVLGHERNTIEIFRAATGSVVFVTNERLQRHFLSLNVQKDW